MDSKDVKQSFRRKVTLEERLKRVSYLVIFGTGDGLYCSKQEEKLKANIFNCKHEVTLGFSNMATLSNLDKSNYS